ncbi:hercynylcysteine S-oxide lyase [Acrasis kona]|uniref:Hercynylcysteine S-oxide lyase n=1 Tax=Acrasis kona TaxID=1008807 RepID=A0AAW2Z2D5_9EUKA
MVSSFHTLLIIVVAFTMAEPQFGHQMRKHFLMKEDLVNLNAAAFGTMCRPAYESQRKYVDIMESNPNIWFRGVYQEPLNRARTRISKYVNAKEDDLVIVENASAAINAIMRSLADGLNLGKGDAVLYMNIAYPMVKNIINYLAKVRGFDVLIVDIKFPITSDDDFIVPVQTAISKYNGRVRVAALDHMSSYPSCILPIKKLTQICHDQDIAVVVDGAQVMGQIPLDITDIGADFYTANTHKWMYSPKSSALLHVDPKWHSMVQPIVISSEYGEDFVTNFLYVGTRDYCPYLALHEAMDFRESLGGDQVIMKYNHDLAWKGANLVANSWNTTVLVQKEDMNGALVSVQLPCDLESGMDVAKAIFDRHQTYIQLGHLDGLTYVRLCAQIFLELNDFELFAQRFKTILSEIKQH